MDVREAPSRLHHLLRPRPPFLASFLLCSPRFLSPYVCWHIPMQNAFRFSLCEGNCNSGRRSPVMSARKGNSTCSIDHLEHLDGNSVAAFEGLCEVLWTVEADLADGQLLYITGEPVVLGCWEPKKAILMVPTGHSKLWQAEIKIAHGVSCKYNYFIKEETWPSSDIFWRPGPAFSLSVPVSSKQDKKIMVRDSWMTCNTERSLSHKWELWMEDTFFPIQPLIQGPKGDIIDIMKLLVNGVPNSKHFRNDPGMDKNSEYEDTSNAKHKGEIVNVLVNGLAKPKLVLNGHEVKDRFSDDKNTDNATHEAPNSDMIHYDRDQPIEEPWLVLPRFLTMTRDTVDLHIQHYQDTEKLLPEEGNDLIAEDDSASTTILINSSVCTMQRIAILEDDELVELLLEPVKSSVQSDSVYLGVFVRWAPKLGGAFIDIGGNKLCLMSINQNREPFIFQPFCGMKNNKKSNGLKKNPAGQHNEGVLEDDVEVIEDHIEIDSQDPVRMTNGDYEMVEVEEADFDVPGLKDNADIIDYVDVEIDLEDDLDGVEHLFEEESVKVPNITEHSNHSLMPYLQRLKESRVTSNEGKWDHIQKGTKIIVQVLKEGLGTKGPTVTPYPKLKSRFWILFTRCDTIGVSLKITGGERTRLKHLAKSLQPPGFGLTVRTFAAGRSTEELEKDLLGLLSTWEDIFQEAADEAAKGAVPVILHRAMGQTLSVAQEYFNEKVKRMVVDSQRTYNEVTNYLQGMAPDLCDRVELHKKRIPLFDQFNIEEEFNNILNKRVPLPNGGSLVIEQTEALVSIDVNGGHGMFGGGDSQENANLEVNLAAAKRIAREIRLRGIGGIIVVDFIDMEEEVNKKLVYEEVKKALKRDRRSMVKVSELSRNGLMEITRKRVRPSVTFMISEPCPCCRAAGRVEALETSFAKIEQKICRYLAKMKKKVVDSAKHETPTKFTLWVDKEMSDYLTSGQKTRLALLNKSLKVRILLKVSRGLARGAFTLKLFKEGDNSRNVALLPIKKGKAFKKLNAGARKPRQESISKRDILRPPSQKGVL